MKRVLVICGDTWHPAETVRRGLELLCPGDFEFVEGGANRQAARLQEFSVIVLAGANIASAKDQRPWPALDSEMALRDYVRHGNDLVVIHSGTSRHERLPGMQELIGGTFKSHPDPCAVTLEPCAAHSLAAGAAQFTVPDEHYFMAMSGVPVDVFLHSRSEHGLQPAGWTRTVGNGRICVLTPGHTREVWLHPSFQRLLLNALRWTAKMN